MNTVSIQNQNPTTLHMRPIRRPSAFGNLIRKECQESREAAIAGLAVFWLVPALLELIEFVLAGRYGSFPFAWSLLVGAGWIYAIILGAHTVCRDWGKAEEHFLLAQPVSAQAVVGAKLITGAMLIVSVMAIVVVWETMLAHWGVFGLTGTAIQQGVSYWHPARVNAVAAVSAMAVGYTLAFAVAVMTRQMLASTVVATLAMLVWAIAPLLSSHLTRFSMVPFSAYGTPTSINRSFAVVSVLGLIVCVATSFLCAARERMFRLGHKPLAWTIGLVMLALFGIAMTEVGNSLQVRDQAEAFDSALLNWGGTRMIHRGDRFFISYYSRGRHKWSMTTFRVDDNGRIQNLRRTTVPGMLPSVRYERSNSNRQQVELGDELAGFAFDEKGQLVVTGRRMRLAPISRNDNTEILENLWRTTLAWPDGGEPEVLSRVELMLPPDKNLADIWSDYPIDTNLPRYAYLHGGGKLYVFDWSEGPHPTPQYEIPLQDVSYVSVRGSKLSMVVRSGDSQHEVTRAATFDAGHPETLLDKQNWSFHVVSRYPAGGYPWEPDYWWPQEFDRPGGLYLQVDQHGDVAYLSDLLGLRIARQTHPKRWEIVGECRTSPLAMLFRSVPQPNALDESLLIEHGMQGLIAYDVSNPSKPRRVGYFNAMGLWHNDTVLATERHLVLLEFNLITVLDRPDLPGKRVP